MTDVTTGTVAGCAYDVVLPGIDNEAPCGLPRGHDGRHATTTEPADVVPCDVTPREAT